MLFRTNLTYSENLKLFDIIFNDSDFHLCEIPLCEIHISEIFNKKLQFYCNRRKQ